ncbi:MAG: tyrosine-type recombinase/integrase [Nocardioidaceae bacterium]
MFNFSGRCRRIPGQEQRRARLSDGARRDGIRLGRPHTYRKTVATMLDQVGLSARTIADQLGHSRISMTQTCISVAVRSTKERHLRCRT